ncbi:hypothetical protein [Streptomyces sparsogenes]|uniref:hypothetical protein n=1 Tax=Streptomyces sparsogenes TaxID=67365 RepID=UPI0033E0CB86
MTDSTDHEAVAGLMQSMEAVHLLFDAADGMRADLERRGWTPPVAEQIAQTWLVTLMYGSMGIGKPA